MTGTEEAEETFEWVILREHAAGIGDVNRQMYVVVGSLTLDTAYYVPSSAAADIARLGDGPGVYLAICGTNCRQLYISSQVVYEMVTPETVTA
jgi:hypothetical protein